jgi:D-3-phosphoglycerate dehydrogenase
MIRIVVCDGLEASALSRLRESSQCVVETELGTDSQQRAEKMDGADFWVVRSATKVDASKITKHRNLKGVVRAGVGLDNVDLVAASREGVAVWNAPDGAYLATAEWAMAAIFGLARQFPLARDLATRGVWGKKEFSQSIQVSGATLGIVGLGNIGRRLKKLAESLGMRVLVFDPAQAGQSCATLEELLGHSDFVSIHVPLIPATENLFSAKRLRLMKKGSYLICAARGGIIDEKALVDQLDSGHLAGAALDVFQNEPWEAPTLSWIRHPKVLATPHVASSTQQGQRAIGDQVATLLLSFCESLAQHKIPAQWPLNSVDWSLRWLKRT